MCFLFVFFFFFFSSRRRHTRLTCDWSSDVCSSDLIHILATLFPRRHVGSLAVAGQDLAFFKVDVDRVIPATATVLNGPDFARAVARRSRNAAPARVEHLVVVHLNAPWSLLIACAKGVGRRIIHRQRLGSAASELEGPSARDWNGGQIGV